MSSIFSILIKPIVQPHPINKIIEFNTYWLKIIKTLFATRNIIIPFPLNSKTIKWSKCNTCDIQSINKHAFKPNKG
jgi:hypothetical protein